MMPSSSDLRYFLEVSATGNISRAAERLGISQPSLSLAIQRVETAIGMPLLLRSKTGVQLTRTGSRVARQARLLLEEWERIRSEAAQAEEEIAGSYTLGLHPSVALYTLPVILGPLLEAHPKLEVRVHHDLSRKVTEDVVSFKVDFGIVVNPVEHPDLVIRTLLEDEVTFWTGPARKRKSPLQDPSGKEAVLICDPELLQTQALLKQVKRGGGAFARTVTSSNLEVVASLVASGAGIGILPARVAGRVASYGLRRLPGGWPSVADRICLVYRADLQKSEAGRKMARFIEERLRPLRSGEERLPPVRKGEELRSSKERARPHPARRAREKGTDK